MQYWGVTCRLGERWLGALVCGLVASSAWALEEASPALGRYDCVAHAKGWFEADMAPVFTLEVLDGARYRIQTRRSVQGEGRFELAAWTGDAASVAAFERGTTVLLKQSSGAALLVGLYGERGQARSWLLRIKDSGNAYVRCGDVVPIASGNVSARAEVKTVNPPVDSERGVDQPTPPVRLPAGARLGGAFESGRYACSKTIGASKREFAYTYEFYDNGEWRRPNVRDEEGSYTTRPQTGRFDNFKAFRNSRYHPNEDYAVYYRSAANVSHIYAFKDGSTVEEMRCVRQGPVQEDAPEVVKQRELQKKQEAQARNRAEVSVLSQRNLHPPEPGRTRWDGLFASDTFHQRERLDPGSYGMAARIVIDVWSTWSFLEFQSNGWIYLGLRSPQEPCNSPRVDDDGEPLCTTYSVDGGRLRVGHEDRGPVSRVGGDIKLGKQVYRAVPPLTPQRLAGLYTNKSCQGALCSSTSWWFSADGRFSASGLGQGVGVGAGPAGAPMPRSWVHTQKVEGRYQIVGQGLQLTDNAGQDFPVSVFLYPPKNDTIRINGQELIRPSNK